MDFSFVNFRFYTYVEINNGTSPKDIHNKLLKLFNNNTPAYSTIKKWCQKFVNSSDEPSFFDQPRSGRPRSSHTDENVTIIKNLIDANPKLSSTSICETVQISKETVLNILHQDLELRKVCSMWIPHNLTEMNKQERVGIAKEILIHLDDMGEDVHRLYAVEDETWVSFDPLLPKQENKCWLANGQQRHTIVRPKLTNRKALLLLCFTGNKKVVIEALPYGETVDSQRYITFLKKVGDNWRTLRRDSTRLNEVHFQHDNARPHTSAATRTFIERRGVTMVPQPPYSPDYNLCDRWLFAALKTKLKKMTFRSAEEVKVAALQAFDEIPENRFPSELIKLRDHLNAVILKHGDYIIK